MDFFTSMEVSASGLSAERERMNVASSNLANVNTTKGADGGPYRRQEVMMQARPASGNIAGAQAGGAPPGATAYGTVVSQVISDQNPPRLEYDPGHPDANADGYVAYPNVSPVEEMVDMITASRAYEAGITSLTTAVSMAERALSIGR